MGQADRLQHLPEERKPIKSRQPAIVAVAGNRQTFDELHGEIRDAVQGDAGIVETRDVLVLERGEQITLTRIAFLRSVVCLEARVRDLEGHLTQYGCRLLGEPHRRHAARADQAQQPVGADHGPGLECGGRRTERSREQTRRRPSRERIGARRMRVRLKQSAHKRRMRGIARLESLEPSLARLRFKRERFVDEAGYPHPLLAVD